MPIISRKETFETTDEAFNIAEIENLKTIIYEYSKAIKALVSGTHSRYDINTGQTSQSVTRLDMSMLVNTRKQLIDELETRQAQAGLIRSCVQVVPGC
jgi:hypothetical protein